MKELLRTTDPVLLSRLAALMAESGIEVFRFDFNASMVDGSIGAVPQRLMVADDELNQARRVILEEGLGDCLPEEKV